MLRQQVFSLSNKDFALLHKYVLERKNEDALTAAHKLGIYPLTPQEKKYSKNSALLGYLELKQRFPDVANEVLVAVVGEHRKNSS